MIKKQKAVMCWSGGKDSALALHKIKEEDEYEIVYLLTTINAEHGRISMHGVREELLELQALSIGIPLIKIYVQEASNLEYERQMEKALLSVRAEGVVTVVFGDIFLEDLRVYREANLAKVGMKAVFPLWNEDTSLLILEFLRLGFKTITCCVSDSFLTKDDVGKVIDSEFVKNIPEGVDLCGENGEYHTFCYHGPLFKKQIRFSLGEKLYRPLEIKSQDECSLPSSVVKGFWFCDLLPA